MHISKKEARLKRLPYDASYMTFCKCQNRKDKTVETGCQGFTKKGGWYEQIKLFLGQ